MIEPAKRPAAFVLFVAATGASSLFVRRNAGPAAFRLGALCAGPAAVAPVRVLLPRPPDAAPDFLAADAAGDAGGGTYLERDGFAFRFASGSTGGLGALSMLYQNQTDARRLAHVELRPRRTPFSPAAGGAADFDEDLGAVRFGVAAGPGEVGVQAVPVPVPAGAAGGPWEFEVAATVTAPDGPGGRLRRRVGEDVPTEAAPAAAGGLAAGALVAAMAAGVPVSRSRTFVTLPAPAGPATLPPDRAEPVTAVGWTPDAAAPAPDLFRPVASHPAAAADPGADR